MDEHDFQSNQDSDKTEELDFSKNLVTETTSHIYRGLDDQEDSRTFRQLYESQSEKYEEKEGSSNDHGHGFSSGKKLLMIEIPRTDTEEGFIWQQ